MPFSLFFLNIFVQNCLKSKEKLKRFTFQDRQKFFRKPFRQLRLPRYDYCSEATMPGNESIQCEMTIAVNHSTKNNSKPMVNHANIHPYCFKTFEVNVKFSLRDFKQSMLSFSSKKKQSQAFFSMVNHRLL